MTVIGPNSPLAANHVVASHNPIQLAAISNYKLAQLTFAPPDIYSLRKTAVIKNMLDDIYTSTPQEWLQQMTRWQYFTPESLDEMTQEGLEEIFQQYAQTIEAFRPIKSTDPYQDDGIFFDEDDDGQGDDLWIADEHEQEKHPTSKTNSIDSVSSIFSQPNATIIANDIASIDPKSLSDKPLPANPVLTEDKQRRFSGNKNRLSWTSDTGITSSAVSQNLANELMNLFDMDFAVDIKINTAPKLPELPFPRRKSQQRQSLDMLTSLLPAFDKIALENSLSSQERYSSLLNSSNNRPGLIIQSVPQRSSSLRHRQELQSENKVQSPVSTPPLEKSVSKKKSILRLASLMTGKKHHKKENTSPETSPIKNTPRKTSTSTIDSATSSSSYSSWSSLSDTGDVQVAVRVQKPLPKAPGTEPKLCKKKKRSSKRKGNDETTGSKSGFIKMGLNKPSKKQVRRTSSTRKISEYQQQLDNIDFQPSELYTGEPIDTMNDQHSFVKKMTSFHWRTKSRKSVEV